MKSSNVWVSEGGVGSAKNKRRMEVIRARNCAELAALLGLHELPKRRTMESARAEVHAFYEEHGRRPMVREMESLNGWLRYHHQTTLSGLCDDMGLPPNTIGRTLEGARREIQEFYEKHGRRPFPKDLARLSEWLSKHGSSLRQLCNEMGLDGGPCLDRTIDSARQEIQEFYEVYGRRPTTVEKTALNAWLRSHDLSLHKLADQMGLPGSLGLRSRRTMKDARQELQDFYDRYRRRPRKKELSGLRRWLEKRRLTLSVLWDELGLPDFRVHRDRTLESTRRELQVFYEEHGRRPMVREMESLNGWLRYHHQTTLSGLCDDMGLPGGKPGGRQHRHTMESARAEVRAFYEEHRRRPMIREMESLNGWLRRHYQTTLSGLCDELHLSEPSCRTMKEARREIQEFYEKHGRRPTQTDLGALNAWLYQRKLSVAKLCDAMGLFNTTSRDMETAKHEIREFYGKHGRRPTANDLRALNTWLSKKGSSVAQLCHKMKLPGGRSPYRKRDKPRHRTSTNVKEQACQEIREFYDVHGRAPTTEDMRGLNVFLRQNGFTLWQICVDLGITEGRRPPSGLPGQWSMSRAHEELQAFYDEHGRRPRHREMRALTSFLQRHGKRLGQVCDELGLPPPKPLRSLDSIRGDVQQFFDTNGRRPTADDLGPQDQWLRAHHSSSLREICEERGLPGGHNRGRTRESVSEEIRAFFQQYGRRPRAREMPKINSWLWHRGIKLTELCDELGLK